MEFCYKNDTPWGVTKTVSPSGPVASGTAVQFTVQITRGATSSNIICAVGYVSIKNGGTNTAFIGNIVVNLQKRVGSRWVSAAADVADATLGDGATSANIVASQSQERANFYNYTVSGQKGTFNETIGSSGTLSFTDADANTLFALTPSFNLGRRRHSKSPVRSALRQYRSRYSSGGITTRRNSRYLRRGGCARWRKCVSVKHGR